MTVGVGAGGFSSRAFARKAVTPRVVVEGQTLYAPDLKLAAAVGKSSSKVCVVGVNAEELRDLINGFIPSRPLRAVAMHLPPFHAADLCCGASGGSSCNLSNSGKAEDTLSLMEFTTPAHQIRQPPRAG